MADGDFTTMKRRLLCMLGLSTLALGPLLPERAEAAPPNGYSIYCRGGQGRTELNVAARGVVVEKQFLHGTSAYNPATLQPGTCAWPDRAMRANEPYRLLYGRKLGSRDHVTVSGNMQLGLWGIGNGVLVEKATPPDFLGINRLQSPNFIVELRVESKSLKRKRRSGSVREIKVLEVNEVGVSRQIGSSNRG